MNKVLPYATVLVLTLATSLVFGFPWAEEVSNVPSGSTVGGGGGLLPSYDSGSPTSETISNSVNSIAGFSAGVGGIMSFKKDRASALDESEREYEITSPAFEAFWTLHMDGQVTVGLETLGAPGNNLE